MNFLFACGGTAGHINPALAIAAELRRRIPNAEILFVGADREMEKRLIPPAGYELVNIKMSGLKRGFSPSDLLYNIKTFRNLTAAGKKTAKIIEEFKPQAVIGTGGYICYPVLKKGARMGIPTFVHESNAVPGLTTMLLSSIVDRVLVSFPGIEKNYRCPDRVVFTGTPVRLGFEAEEQNFIKKESNKKPLVLSFWGSLGAEHMNETIADFIKLNVNSREFNHIHATGKSNGVAEMKARLKQIGVPDDLPPGMEIREYIDDMQSVMEQADIVLCRAGGSTVAELTVMGKPAVLIPSPYVSNNEQEKNAEQLLKAGGAVMLKEKNCSGEVLYNIVTDILRNDNKLKNMLEAQKALGVPKAAQGIADLIITFVTRNEGG